MSESEGDATQRDLRSGIVAELAAAGFDGAEEIGRGGFGVVYRCAEQSLDRTVAVKVLTSEVHGDERERFVREQHALGRLSGHPNIVEVYQVDITSTGKPFIVMPYYPQSSLDAQLRAAGPFHWRDALSIAVKLAGALAAAHVNDIVHRDVKPANILLTDYGQPLLADFGIVRFVSEFPTATGVFVGTPTFTAPEVLSGKTPQAAADVYSLGATLFCLITGHAAFERRPGESMADQLRRIATVPVRDLNVPDMPEEMAAAICETMAINPADRPSAAQFGERCREVQRRHGQTVDMMAVPAATSRRRGQGTVPEKRIVGMGAVTPSAATKFRPPTSPRSLVARPRLLQTLRQGEPRRLVLIHGPAGFGKSTLAVQWTRSLESAGMSVAWLAVDADDNNVVWFLIHLVEAIRQVRPELAQDLHGVLEERSESSVRYVIAALIDEIHDSGEPIAVVIDDWHRVTSRASIEAMSYLLEHGCHHLRLVVTSRTRTGLPLSTMSVADELVEIDSTALRFEETEAQSFLVDVNGLPLDDLDILTLQESTQGWVAALQLASLSLRGRDDPGEFIGRLSDQHQAIGDYLADNVLDQVDPALLDFLMSTSVTEKVCGDLATALSGVAAGDDMLEQVLKQDLFLHRAEDESQDGRQWFRYHRLFADHLQHRLGMDRAIRLHQMASAWFADHGLLNDAVDHALAAREPERVMQLVIDHGEELFESSRLATLLGLVAKLPRAMAEANPLLQLYIAWPNLVANRHVEAGAALDHVDVALNADTADTQGYSELRFGAAVARTASQYAIDRFSPLPEVLIAHLDDEVTSFSANAALHVASLDALNRFDFDEVRRRQRQAATFLRHSKGPLTVMFGHCLAGLAAYEQLDVAAAENSFRTAHMLALRSGTHSFAARLASALRGGLLYQMGKLDDAEALLDEGLELGPEGGSMESLMASYGIGARIKAVRGNLAAAEQRLDEGAKIAENLSVPRLAACIVNERIRAGLPIAEEEHARLLWLEPYRRQLDGTKAMTSELEQDSAIRLLLAESTLGAAESACARAESMIHEIGTQNRPRALLQAQLTHIACLAAAGRQAEAILAIGPVLAQCAEHDLPQFVVDSGWQLAPIITAFQHDIGASGRLPPMFMRKVMAASDLNLRP
ncbi:protein kinase [Nocardia sp. SYP-A9097]|uniref:serine/threonine-protein kinase n=1 Tax=Nocardia sp. SYP-A9097 TaxID=2663237 RepID=UPI00129B4DBE|nr:serine/threonine-protein kinase [Nocardia sp. SYP-A9097]MRH90923.1 protein kinase [Nocardia sp. SYP-A9097]